LLLLAACLWLGGCAAPSGFETAGGCEFTLRAVVPVVLRGGVPLVPARVDGETVLLILDTGGERSVLTEAAVRRLHLPRLAGAMTRVVGIGGSSVQSDARSSTLSIGGIALGERAVVVADAAPVLRGLLPDGRLGVDVLSHYDVDLNLPGGQMILYRARDCAEQGPGWASGSVAVAPDARGLLFMPMRVDGQELGALVDTGAERTSISLSAAARLGLSGAVLANDPAVAVEGAARGGAVAYLHRFREVAAGKLRLRNRELAVAPLPGFASDALLGTDVFRQHRVLLSWASGAVWFSPARPVLPVAPVVEHAVSAGRSALGMARGP
jgi:predicted aspartyl protease